MRLLADENFSAKIASWLRSLGHDVKLVEKSTPDPLVAAQARTESRVILTHDTDFAKEELHPPSTHSGVLLVRINPLHADKVKAAIVRTLGQVQESSWGGKVFFVFEDITLQWRAGEFVPRQ